MKYLVITAKHHEGFAMWDSKVASFTDTTGRTAVHPAVLRRLQA